MKRVTAIKNSALWAAYGDAVGFISELTTQAGLKKRSGVDTITATIPWKRQIGGKFGVVVELPAGCYSDDTQLRLATSRSINVNGFFDVEAFAKVELPLWLGYKLGAGRGSTAAANNLIKKNITWATNFFEKNNINYINCGGNGAAMRIQPHVWSFAKNNETTLLLRDIIRNVITTHGHPRGILGAVFHALCLLFTLDKKRVPSPEEWKLLLKKLNQVSTIVADDPDLSYRWLPEWERQTKQQFDEACLTVIKEIEADIAKIEPLLLKKDISQYSTIVATIDGFKSACRGSGTKTALLASVLAFLSEGDAEKTVLTAANTLNSDTDTIATMAGALVGSITQDEPQNPIADRDYIIKETERLYRISEGTAVHSFVYPDLLKWDPPSTPLDAIKRSQFGLIFSSFGKITVDGQSHFGGGKYPAIWRWIRLPFGQRILLKHRAEIEEDKTLSEPSTGNYKNVKPVSKTIERKELPLTRLSLPPSINDKPLTVNDAFEKVKKSNFSPKIIGEMFLSITDSNLGVELPIAFAALVSNARLEQTKQQINRGNLG